MEVPEWLRLDRLVDVKGNDNTWKVGKVLKIEQDNAIINFDGWSSYTSTYPVVSKRLAPFRRYTVKYTGMQTTKRPWTLTEKEMTTMESRLSRRLEKSLYCKDAYNTTQFYRGELYIFMENLILWDFSECQEVLERIVAFFTNVMRLIVKLLEAYPGLFLSYSKGIENPELYLSDNAVALANTWPEVMETLNKMLAMEPRCQRFFMQYHVFPPDYIFCDLTLRRENYSKTFIYLLNLYASLGGFDCIINIVNTTAENSKVPINFLSSFMLYSLKDFITAEYFSAFSERLSSAIIQRIQNIDEKDLKLVDSDTLVTLLTSQKSSDSKITDRTIEASCVILYSKMLNSTFMEKRIRGINEIAGYLDRMEKNVLTESEILEMLNCEILLRDILESRMHAEILKRSNQILKLFAKNNRLSLRECEIIWTFSQDQQKLISDAGFSIIIEISPWLNDEMAEFFYKRLIAFPDQALNLQAIADFSLKILQQSNGQKIYGVDFLYNLILDSSESSRWKEATDLLAKIYSDEKATALRNEFLASLTEKLCGLGSVPQYLHLTLGILKSLTKDQIIEIFQNIKIEDSLLKNTLQYLAKIKEEHRKIKKDTYFSKFTHHEQILCRLEIMEYIFNKSEFQVCLKKSRFKKLWIAFIKSPACNKDPLIFYKSINSGVRFGPLINNFSEIFNSFFLDKKYFSVSEAVLASFKAFKFFFFKSNSPDHIEMLGKRMKYVQSHPLLGLENLVNMFLEGDTCVTDRSIKLLRSLLTYYSGSISAQEAANHFTVFLTMLMEKLLIADSTMISRVVDLFIKMLDLENTDMPKFSFYAFKGDKFHEIILPLQVRVRYARKMIATKVQMPLEEVAFKIADIEYSHIHDNKIIKLSRDKPIILYDLGYKVTEFLDAATIFANNARVLRFIFSKAVHDQECREKSWTFISKLPENAQLEKELTSLQKNIQEIFPEDDFEFLYCLYTVKRLCEQQEWVNRFIQIGGQSYINQRYASLKLEKHASLIPKQEEAIIHVMHKVFVNELMCKECINAIFQTFCDVTSVSDQLENPIIFISQIDELLNYCSNNFEVITKEVCADSVPKLVNNLLEKIINCTGNRSYLSKLITMLLKLINFSDTAESCLQIILNLKSYASDFAKFNYYWRLFYKTCEIDGISSSLLERILRDLSEDDLPALYEPSGTEANLFLWGVLNVLRVCTQKCHNSYDIFQLMSDLLLNIPQDNDYETPRCKHRETREAAYDYVLAMALKEEVNFSKFLEYFNENFHQTMVWRNNNYKNWYISISFSEKSRLGFVGLENPGCVCYMNSLFQQLYMIRTFSNGLLQLNTDSQETVLYQLKRIFVGLKYSDSPYISPRRFCKNFKDFDGKSVNVFEQMDADEFFGRLMEKMEEDLKNTEEKTLIKNHFGGTQAVEMISNECQHRKERLELMLSVPLDVKNKAGLQDSLKSLVNGEILQGENAYFCESCQKKVSAVMRTSLKYLPNFLVFALRRFEFDLDTMTRKKIDDKFEFPFEVNMKEFTTEYLNNTQHYSDDYYNYKLKGVVIHHGRAEQGHYFSYIRGQEGGWFEFNDTVVSVIDVETVRNNGFGQNQKTKSVPTAYLLLYERDEKFLYTQPDSMMDIPQTGNKEHLDFKEIQQKNLKFWRKKYALSHDYLHLNFKFIEIDNFPCGFALKFFMTILIRVERYYKEKVAVFKFIESNMNEETTKILLDTITSENGIKEFFMFCPNPLSRKLIALLAKLAIDRTDALKLELYFTQFLRMARYSIKSCTQYFTHYLDCLAYFAEKLPNFIIKENLSNLMVRIALGFSHEFPSTDFPDVNHLGYTGVYNISPIRFTDTFGASITAAISIISSFSDYLTVEFSDYLTSQPGYESLLNEVSSKACRRAYASLYAKLFSAEIETSVNFALYLLTRYFDSHSDHKIKFIVIFSQFLKRHQHRLEVLRHVLDYYTENIPQQSPAETQQLIEYLLKIINQIPYNQISESFPEKKLEIIKSWLEANMRPKFNEEVIENQVLIGYHTKLSKIKEEIISIDIDSDDELPEKCTQPGGDIFVYDSGRKQWQRGKVEETIGREILLIGYTVSGTHNYALKDVNYEEVYPR